MNREIKFRIFDKYTKIMSKPFEISELTDWDIIWSDRFYDQDEVSFCDLIWMQFTGLKDRNGTEIYEGDIIQINHPFRRRKYTGKVFFSDGQFNGEGFYFSHYDTPNNCFSEGLEYIEVIGDIYQNPELLNNK